MLTSSLHEHAVSEDTPMHVCHQCGKPDVYLFDDSRCKDCTQPRMVLRCYQCDRHTSYLFMDSRCGDCTRLTPEEVRGEHT